MKTLRQAHRDASFIGWEENESWRRKRINNLVSGVDS